MDQISSGERDLEAGIIIVGSSSSEDTSLGHVSCDRQLSRLSSGNFCGVSDFIESNKGENILDLCSSSTKRTENGAEDTQLLIEKNSKGEEGQLQKAFWKKVYAIRNKKKKNSKKPPKPPLPPKGPSLDDADMKLIKELAERAKEKRMQKMKVTKAVSSNSSYRILAAVTAIFLFCLTILCYGSYTRNSSIMRFQRSPGAAAAGGEGLISIQYYNLSPNAENGPSSEFLNSLKHLRSASPMGGISRGAR